MLRDKRARKAMFLISPGDSSMCCPTFCSQAGQKAIPRNCESTADFQKLTPLIRDKRIRKPRKDILSASNHQTHTSLRSFAEQPKNNVTQKTVPVVTAVYRRARRLDDEAIL